MYKKNLYQITLILFVFLICFTTFNLYFSEKDIKDIIEVDNNEKVEIGENSNNLIQNIEYQSIDGNGNKYLIKADKGEADITDPKIIFMKGVKASVITPGQNPIYIMSNFAEYNTLNYDTSFIENVKINYENHTIEGQKFDLSIENNLAAMTDDIIYTNLDNKLAADRLEIDLITKNSRIFMNNKQRKIKMSGSK